MSKQQLKTNKEVKRKRSLQYKREQHQGQRKKHRNECYLPQSRCLPSFLPQFHQTLSLFLFSQQSCCSSKSSKNPTFIRPKSQKPNLPIIRIWSSPEESGDAKKKEKLAKMETRFLTLVVSEIQNLSFQIPPHSLFVAIFSNKFKKKRKEEENLLKKHK